MTKRSLAQGSLAQGSLAQGSQFSGAKNTFEADTRINDIHRPPTSSREGQEWITLRHASESTPTCANVALGSIADGSSPVVSLRSSITFEFLLLPDVAGAEGVGAGGALSAFGAGALSAAGFVSTAGTAGATAPTRACSAPTLKPNNSSPLIPPGNGEAEIIPKFFSLLSDNKPLTIQGSGLNSRRYLYGADAADAFDVILHKGEVGEAYNVGSAFEITNLEVAVRMLQLFGHSPQADFHERLLWIQDRPFNDFDYRVDGSKLKALGWDQTTSFGEGLGATVDWYRKNMERWWTEETKRPLSGPMEVKKAAISPMTEEVSLPTSLSGLS